MIIMMMIMNYAVTRSLVNIYGTALRTRQLASNDKPVAAIGPNTTRTCIRNVNYFAVKLGHGSRNLVPSTRSANGRTSHVVNI